jgi:predicted permease
LILPIIIIIIAKSFNLSPDIITGLALEAGMSSIVIAIVVCDRYHLDTNKYIEVVTITLLLSLGSLPLWKWLLT